MILLIFLLLFSPLAYGDMNDLAQERSNMLSKGKTLTAQEESDLTTKGWRSRREGEFDPPVTKHSRPADYVNNWKRGQIEFNPKWRNYSLHKVRVPSGTIIDGEKMGGCNFTQIEPGTDAFDRIPGVYGHNLTIRNCNLTNVKTYPDWTIENCNNVQAWRVVPDGSILGEDGVFIDQNGQVAFLEEIRVAHTYEDLPPTYDKPDKGLQ